MTKTSQRLCHPFFYIHFVKIAKIFAAQVFLVIFNPAERKHSPAIMKVFFNPDNVWSTNR